MVAVTNPNSTSPSDIRGYGEQGMNDAEEMRRSGDTTAEEVLFELSAEEKELFGVD